VIAVVASPLNLLTQTSRFLTSGMPIDAKLVSILSMLFTDLLDIGR